MIHGSCQRYSPSTPREWIKWKRKSGFPAHEAEEMRVAAGVEEGAT
jgi:hypothetical protein